MLLAAGCKKPETVTAAQASAVQRLHVTSNAGLRMRSEPHTRSSALLTIPHNSEVVVVEESDKTETISGKMGKWLRVTYNGSTGWVFGAFLAPNAATGQLPQKLKYEVENCGCPGGCGYTKITLSFSGAGTVAINHVLEASDIFEANYVANYTVKGTEVKIAQVRAQSQLPESMQPLSDFSLQYNDAIQAYIPAGSYFQGNNAAKAITDRNFSVDQQKCVFLSNKADSCGVHEMVCYFCESQ